MPKNFQSNSAKSIEKDSKENAWFAQVRHLDIMCSGKLWLECCTCKNTGNEQRELVDPNWFHPGMVKNNVFTAIKGSTLSLPHTEENLAELLKSGRTGRG